MHIVEVYCQSKWSAIARAGIGIDPAADQGAFKGDVNIQASKEVQFKIIKRVMFSCATAGYQNINFAVTQSGGAAATLGPDGKPLPVVGKP